MSRRPAFDQKDCSILKASQLAMIRKRAKPQEPDCTAELEHSKMLSAHERTLKATETWANSVVNERKARINRLEKQKQEREEEMKKIDEQERLVQKAARKEALLRAEEIAFQEKAEIRAVNAQLMLHEAVRERQRQVLMKERRKQIEQEREDAWAAQEKARIEAEEEHERELARQRRLKAIETAEGFKQQRMEAQQRKKMLRDQEKEEERMLAEEAQRQLEAEQLEEVNRKARELKNIKEAKESNATLIAWRAKQKQIEMMEDERIKQQKIRQDDEMEERQAADLKRRRERQAAIDRLIETQQRNLAEIKSQQQAFDDTQYELQWQKEKKEMDALRNKQERLAEERRKDYQDAIAKLEAKRRLQKKKATFPIDEATKQQEEAAWELEVSKRQGLKDLAEFQKQQALEKKEREAADKERRQLEFQRDLELEAQKTAEAQEYAREMLLAARQQRYRK